MGKREICRKRVDALWCDRTALEVYLIQGSGIPVPRTNLDLAAAVADAFGAKAAEPSAWERAVSWSSIDASLAPANSPSEFLPYCAVQGMGAMRGGINADVVQVLTATIGRAASDDRWRLRDASAMALQRVGEGNLALLRNVCETWMQGDSPLQMRAVSVALAHPPLLANPELGLFALSAMDRAMDLYAAQPRSTRALEPWLVLRKALEFVPSVCVAALPRDGFAMLQRWASSSDPDVRKLVVANARKTRLAGKFADDVEAIGQALAWSADDGFTDQ